MLSFMDIYKIQTEHLTKLCQNAKEAGMYAYGTGESTTENIVLPDVYGYQPVGGLIPLPKIWFHNTVKVHAWTGVQYEESKNGKENQPMVSFCTADFRFICENDKKHLWREISGLRIVQPGAGTGRSGVYNEKKQPVS